MHALLIQIREVTAPPPDEGVTEPVSVYLTEKEKGKGKGRDDVGEKWRNQRVTAPGGHGIIIQLSCCLMSRVLCAGLVALRQVMVEDFALRHLMARCGSQIL